MERRYREHCEGSDKCKYTRSFPPKRIAACWEIQSETASEAMRLERAVKGLSRDLKKNVVDFPENLKQLVSCNDEMKFSGCDDHSKMR